ncbi:HNH endonuclease, partial [Candidatus Parcubacteria bacterium]
IDVDHIVDKANKGGEELSNLWVLCPNCHVKKTLGVITVDLDMKKVYERGKEISLHHDSHLGW